MTTQRATTDPDLHKKSGRATEPLLVTWMYANQGNVPPYRDALVRCHLNQTDDCGRTALHYFASGLTNDEGDYYDDGHVATLARWFCAVGAEIDATDDTGKTPVHHLVDRLFEFPEPDVADALIVLLDAGASPNVVDAYGLTPYARAAIYGDVDTMDIIETHAKVDLDVACARDLPTEQVRGTPREPLVESDYEFVRKSVKGKTARALRDEVSRR